jgi:signal transduction histidine kinase
MTPTVSILDFIIVFIVSFINLFLAFSVYLRNRKLEVNKLFASFLILITLWIVFAMFSNAVTSFSNALFLSKAAYASVITAIAFLFMFSLTFPREIYKKKYINTASSIVVLCSLLISFLIMFSNNIVKTINQTDWGFDVEPGNLSWIFTFYSTIVVLLAVLIFISTYKKTNTQQKNQLQFLFLGLGIFLIANITINIFLKEIINSDQFYKYGNYSIIFFTSLIGYAITKHRLMDIRFIIVRSITYFLLLSVFGIMYMLTIFIFGGLIFGSFTGKEAYWASMIVALLVGFTFYPLKKAFTKWTDKVFFKDRYDFEELTSQLNETATSTIVLAELLFKFLNLLVDEMRVTRGAFVLLEKGKIYESQTLGYKQTLNLDRTDIDHLSKERKIEIFDEAEEGSECKEIMRKHEAVVILPLIAENELIGLLFLGEKKSGDAYTTKDISVLKIVSNQLALGIQNAKAYEQVQKFNFTLRAEINRATKEVKDANTKLVELDKSKDEFISLASHEIRTPIATLEGYLSILTNQKLKPQDHKDILNRAYDSVGRLAILAKDLLDTSRIDQERLVINKVPTRLELLIERVVEGFEFRAKEKGIFVKYKKGNRLLPEINIDPERINEVFNNIIGNAIKFTHRGGITVSAELKDKNNVLVSISDTGEGIPKDDIPNLFKKFYQAQTASSILSKDKGGTGLGLYITKNIIDIHSGKIWIESRLRRGTTFFFTLPIK